MAIKIAILNNKGGVGKTTTATNLSLYLASVGKRVLLIDMDIQGNATYSMHIERFTVEWTTPEIMLGKCDWKKSVIVAGYSAPNKCVVHIIPNNLNQINLINEMNGKVERERLLIKALETAKKEYDFIILDCPPAIDIMTLNAVFFSDYVIVPLQAEPFAVEGLQQTTRLLAELKKPVLGILFTMIREDFVVNRAMRYRVMDEFQGFIFKTEIPRSIAVPDLQQQGYPILATRSREHPVYKAYMDFGKEVLENVQRKGRQETIFD